MKPPNQNDFVDSFGVFDEKGYDLEVEAFENAEFEREEIRREDEGDYIHQLKKDEKDEDETCI